jgi:hypothetical protein
LDDQISQDTKREGKGRKEERKKGRKEEREKSKNPRPKKPGAVTLSTTRRSLG